MSAVMIALAAAGAASGALSTGVNRYQQKTDINRQKQMAKDAYGYQQAYNDNMFSLQKGEALETLGIAQNRLGEAFGADIAGFNLGLAGQALQAQAARASLADSTGMAMAAQGASGTRGSDTLQRRIDFQEGIFDRQADLQTRGNSLVMQGMARQYTNQFSDIGREIDSWGAKGWRTQAKGYSDTYASEMHKLQLKGFKYAMEDMNNPLYATSDYLTSIFGGAAQGADFGAKVSYYNSLLSKGNAAAAAATPGSAAGMQSQVGMGMAMQSQMGSLAGINAGLFFGGL